MVNSNPNRKYPKLHEKLATVSTGYPPFVTCNLLYIISPFPQLAKICTDY